MPVFVVRGVQIVVVGVLAGLAVVAGIGLRAATTSDPATVPVAELGPPPGLGVEDHRLAAIAALDLATGRRIAVVSFRDYRRRSDVEEFLAGHADLDVDGFLVAVPGSMPAYVDDVEAWVTDRVFEAADQLTELEALAPTVGDPEFRAFYEAEIRRYRRLREQADSPPVFGVVVIAPVETLRALVVDPAVRLVDVGVSDRLADDAAVRGLRPEEVDRAGDPEVRP